MRKVKRIYAKIGKYEQVSRESVCYRFKGVYCVYGALGHFVPRHIITMLR